MDSKSLEFENHPAFSEKGVLCDAESGGIALPLDAAAGAGGCFTDLYRETGVRFL